ncbi:hypothetical protein T01_5188 [Trichinella spiralis]|uniref:Uncharacterized protein n=1 Tax=Trichinella spiralis TaxID=6334 RepID=A0A0V1BK43_TRISP|nr:hypothetical protein T01_5188 [Trichinella spiralis]
MILQNFGGKNSVDAPNGPRYACKCTGNGSTERSETTPAAACNTTQRLLLPTFPTQLVRQANG